MKKLWMATTVALVAVTIALLTTAYKPGTNEPKQIVTVKSILHAMKESSGIYVTYPDGKTSYTELPQLSGFSFSSAIWKSNSETAKVLNQLSADGYTLISSGGGSASNSMIEIYVFEK